MSPAPNLSVSRIGTAMARHSRFSILIGLLLLAAVFFVAIHREVHSYDHRIIGNPDRLNTEEWKRPRVAVVFGASVFSNGDLSPVLEDRVDTAIELYRAKKIDRILVSGDNRHHSYNEPKAMYEYLITHAVDKRDVVIDYAGRSTGVVVVGWLAAYQAFLLSSQ